MGQAELIGNPARPLWITEGLKKGDALQTHGCCTITLIGVWNWRGRNHSGGLTALADWDEIALNDRDIYVVFDSDVMVKREVQQALRRLRNFLEIRKGRVHVVYLPADGSAKVGVDDYLLTHSVDELKSLTVPPGQNGQDGQDVTVDISCPYRATKTGLWWQRMTSHGEESVHLANFSAVIVGDIVRDDGAEKIREFEIEATLHDHRTRFVVPAEHFNSLGWASKYLGAQALVYPGPLLQQHINVAIRLLSTNIIERRIFTHTGWRKADDGRWYYFHGGGILGANGHLDNMEVSLPNGLERMRLPDPPAAEAAKAAVQTSLRLWDVAPDRVIIPLVATTWRALLGEADLSVHLAGPTGAGKSEISALVQQHFGIGFDARHLPGSWLSTGNSLEALAFSGKDMVLVVDDFAPGGSATDVARIHWEADRLLRAQGNQAGRGRLRPDGTMRPAKPPRGLILSTGEDVPRGQSLRSRLLIVEVSYHHVDWKRISECQADGIEGQYAQAVAAYVRWLAPRYEQIRNELPAKIAEIRAEIYRQGQHRRTITNAASLLVGMQYFLACALEIGAITQEQHQKLNRRCWQAIVKAADTQGQHQDGNEPTRQFLSLLSAAIASGQGHVAAMDGSPPENASAWGWRERTIGTGDFEQDEWQCPGKRLGWIDGPDLYLEPNVSYAEAQELARKQGESLSVSVQTLRKRLHENGILASIKPGGGSLLVQRTIEGHRPYVLHLRAASLDNPYISIEPAQPAQPAHGTPVTDNGQVFGDEWAGDGQVFSGKSSHEKDINNNGLDWNGPNGQVFESSKSDASTAQENYRHNGQVFGKKEPAQAHQEPAHGPVTYSLEDVMTRVAIHLHAGDACYHIAKLFAAESIMLDGRAVNHREQIKRLWERYHDKTPCPVCGLIDWDRNAQGKVFCIPCSEREHDT